MSSQMPGAAIEDVAIGKRSWWQGGVNLITSNYSARPVVRMRSLRALLMQAALSYSKASNIDPTECQRHVEALPRASPTGRSAVGLQFAVFSAENSG